MDNISWLIRSLPSSGPWEPIPVICGQFQLSLQQFPCLHLLHYVNCKWHACVFPWGSLAYTCTYMSLLLPLLPAGYSHLAMLVHCQQDGRRDPGCFFPHPESYTPLQQIDGSVPFLRSIVSETERGRGVAGVGSIAAGPKTLACCMTMDRQRQAMG